MIIKNGYVIDPVNKKEGAFDILIGRGKIKKVAKGIKASGEEIIDAAGKIVTPGLIDMHVHLREPGREDVETIASGTRAAVAGGITSVAAMPNTRPAMDNAERIEFLKDRIEKKAASNVFIVGAITKERKGRELVDMKAVRDAGAVALSDDGGSIQDESLMCDALKKAKESNLIIISHCEDKNISKNGVVNEGLMATKLGLRSWPKAAEYNFVERDIKLAKKAKARLHIAHVSCKESVDIIRKAKAEGVLVTAETAPHYFSLDETACETYDTRTKMNPPLRSSEDVAAIKEALADGTIDVIASDHAPHGKHEKEIEFEHAAFGIIGLETSLALAAMFLAGEKTSGAETARVDEKTARVDEKTARVGNSEGISDPGWRRLVHLMSANPARILGLIHKGHLAPGADADITIIDPEKEWTYTKNSIRSKSQNSPFINRRFKGKAVGVIVGGKRCL